VLRMEDECTAHNWQDEAITAISRAIRRTRAGLKDPSVPGGVFIFSVRPVWARPTRKTLRSSSSTTEDAIIQLDMSDDMESIP